MSFSLRRLCYNNKFTKSIQSIHHHRLANFSTSNTTTKYPFLSELGLSDYNQGVFNGEWKGNGPEIKSYSPTTNEEIATIKTGTSDDYESCISSMDEAKKIWMNTPAPKRGEIVRTIGDILREKKEVNHQHHLLYLVQPYIS